MNEKLTKDIAMLKKELNLFEKEIKVKVRLINLYFFDFTAQNYMLIMR